ncbi:hypothetical protein HK098_006436 [Nowakowskiella sp. JEL0407]|nr:hypothetical protein HK098_006436 [Nowakowskiella sp. JEL0407]
MSFKFVLAVLAIFPFISARSFLTCPPSINPAGALEENGPCEKLGDKPPSITLLNAGDRLKVGWPSNNLGSGLVRLSLVPINQIHNSSAFDNSVLKYTCFGTAGQDLCIHPCNGRKGCEWQRTKEDAFRYDTLIKAPLNLADGLYVLQWKASLVYNNKSYYSCSILALKGGDSNLTCSRPGIDALLPAVSCYNKYTIPRPLPVEQGLPQTNYSFPLNSTFIASPNSKCSINSTFFDPVKMRYFSQSTKFACAESLTESETIINNSRLRGAPSIFSITGNYTAGEFCWGNDVNVGDGLLNKDAEIPPVNSACDPRLSCDLSILPDLCRSTSLNNSTFSARTTTNFTVGDASTLDFWNRSSSFFNQYISNQSVRGVSPMTIEIRRTNSTGNDTRKDATDVIELSSNTVIISSNKTIANASETTKEGNNFQTTIFVTTVEYPIQPRCENKSASSSLNQSKLKRFRRFFQFKATKRSGEFSNLFKRQDSEVSDAVDDTYTEVVLKVKDMEVFNIFVSLWNRFIGKVSKIARKASKRKSKSYSPNREIQIDEAIPTEDMEFVEILTDTIYFNSSVEDIKTDLMFHKYVPPTAVNIDAVVETPTTDVTKSGGESEENKRNDTRSSKTVTITIAK